MNNALVYISSVAFLLSIFPIYIYNYVYVNTEEKYASANVTVFRFLRLYNINSVKNDPNEMQINGKKKKIDISTLKINFYTLFNKLCIYKIIQLSDFGIQKQNNAYILLTQNSLTTAIYKFLQINGNYCKLRNYTVINEEHSFIRYYAKAVTIINFLVITELLFIYILEKLNEHKN